MADEIVIRAAAPDDHRQLMAMYGDFIETARFAGLDNDGFEKVLASPSNFILVAEMSGKLMGLITASTRPVVRYPIPIMQIDEFYVDAAYREHGVGGKLMDAMVKIAQDQGVRRIYVESGYKHTLGHRFYEKHGYKKEGYYFLRTI